MSVTTQNKEYSQLSQLVPLNTLAQEELDVLLHKVDIEEIKKGQILFREGDVDHVNVYLLSGRIGLYSGNSQVDQLDDSSATSRFPVAHQLPRKFSAKALSKLTIIRIDSRILSESLAKNETAAAEVHIDDEPEDDDADWMSQLLQSRVMQNIPAANLQGVMMRMQEMTAKQGEVIIKEGDEGDFYYLLHKGQAVVLKSNGDDSEETEIVRLGAGASFGEDALLSDSPRSSTVKMLTDGVLLRLSKDDFIELIRHPLSDTVSYDAAVSLIDEGGIWLDVRDPDVYEAAHLPGAINMPYSTLRFQLPSLATDHQYVIYSQSGTKSIASAFLFLERGLQVSILEGGYNNIPQQDDDEDTQLDIEQPLPDSEQSSESISLDSRLTIEALEEEVARLKELLAQKEDSPPVHSDEFEALKKDYEKLEREVIGLSEQLESEEEVYDKLKLQYDRLTAENKKHLKLRDEDLAVLKETLTVMQLEKDQLESDYETLLASQAEKPSEFNQETDADKLTVLLNQVGQLEALNASITEDRDHQRYELEETRNQLSLMNQENSELQLELADLKDRLSEFSARHESTE